MKAIVAIIWFGFIAVMMIIYPKKKKNIRKERKMKCKKCKEDMFILLVRDQKKLKVWCRKCDYKKWIEKEDKNEKS